MRILLKIFGLIKVSLIIAYCFFSCLFVEGKSLPITGELDNSTYFNIYIDKTDYLESEPIWLTADIIIDKKMKLDRKPVLDPSNDLKLILRNSKGDTLKFAGISLTAIGNKDYPDTMFFLNDLLEYFGEPEKLPNSKLSWPYNLPSEQYSLTAILYLRIGGESRFFNSNTVFFSVTKPFGEELEAYNKLLELQVLRSDPTRNLEKVTKSVEEFVSTYPNSVYTKKARYLMTIAGKLPVDKIEFFRNLILDDLNNGYIVSYLYNLRYFYEQEGKQTQFREFLVETQNLYPNTLFDKIIRFKINN